MFGCNPHDDYYYDSGGNRDDYYPPSRPPVDVILNVDSTNITVNDLLKKTSFTYNSWMTADQYTQKIELSASIKSIDTMLTVVGFDFANQTKEIYTKSTSSYYKNELEVIDSVFVYRIQNNSLSYSFELPFQAATYRGDYGTIKLKSHGFSSLIDKGHTLTDMGLSQIGDKFYNCKLYKHTISVMFDGKRYEVVYSLILRRAIEGIDPPLSTKLLASGIKDVVDKDNRSHYTSWIKVLHTRSSGKVEEVTYAEPAMLAYMENSPQQNRIIPNGSLVLQSKGVDDDATHQLWVYRDKSIKTCYIEQTYLVKYNYFYTSCLFSHSRSYYDDGVTVIEMPSLRYVNITQKHTFAKKSSHADYDTYAFSQTLTAKLGTNIHKTVDKFDATVVK